ncbi:ribonucleoside-diphosphate reductase beta chain [Mesoplasma florum L1]|uniref:ribonucleoside-diphosphate reductase n=2 Tax=Mesoplasma florum (strain ATCC 33453 / NBRC 100688 / NCTC 11704 / L1) TaxID=265311 RepID=Q6F0T5_MESFL|nr:class 1b ribonucleoside-diphosphate reductase subunit beta [Mesoplasma florum]AAT75888.1 ribonucleoside-diphosphate reductase beta chain [Mesoplasma florum L1]ATI73495.1 class 1b ribonucleoside-diphosphate reductase subunit beta [Mesoplasma florum]ATI74180.1 class 1b ribonucleoside-diphosphate reductase subunit beta [Mesoplasma florum]AVN59141.1 class 1b ribonucleoside-diphosphate reductase subunit beta [Mesoplasma florum]AVN61192.1 class 1b ribonucleoside-diphosphate reductase subunit beta
MAKIKNQYYNESVSPIEYAQQGFKGKMRSVNWNVVNDEKDLEVWNRITQNFWLPEKIPVSNDLTSWRTLTPEWQELITRTFTGLTLLDTIQATVGDVAQVPNSLTDHEQVIYTNFAFMVAVHARSYGSIFSTLCSSEQIEEAHEWVINTETLQERAKALIPYYVNDDPLKSKVAAALMPGFLLYGGFYLPFYLSARGKLPNTSDIIRLILRDKVIHNYYSGYKYQKKVAKLSPEKQAEMKEFVFKLLYELIDLEKAYLKELYEDFGLADDAIRFSVYNAGKFLQNLGYDSPFTEEETRIEPEIFTQLSARADENHDFFSGNGSSYIMGVSEETEDDDWEF